MYSTPIGAKTPYPKTITTESSKVKEKARREYLPEDPDSEPSSLDSLSREPDSSNDSKYKNKIIYKRKNHRKRTKKDLSDSSTSNSDSSDKSYYKSNIRDKIRTNGKRNRTL